MKKFNGKAIYEPSGKAAEYSPWACNFYTGCSNDCDYCYCKRGVMAHVWDTTPRLKKCFKNEEHALRTFIKELEKNLDAIKKTGIFFSFTTDPLLKETRALTWAAVTACQAYNVPVQLLTKCSLQPDEIPDFPHKNLIAIGFTLTGADELEPGASTNEERIESMQRLHERGYKTFASIEPVIDPFKAEDIILSTLGICDLYKVGLISGKGKDFYNSRYVVELWWTLRDLAMNGYKIYLKDSLLSYIDKERSTLKNFVGADYNIFNN